MKKLIVFIIGIIFLIPFYLYNAYNLAFYFEDRDYPLLAAINFGVICKINSDHMSCVDEGAMHFRVRKVCENGNDWMCTKIKLLDLIGYEVYDSSKLKEVDSNASINPLK